MGTAIRRYGNDGAVQVGEFELLLVHDALAGRIGFGRLFGDGPRIVASGMKNMKPAVGKSVFGRGLLGGPGLRELRALLDGLVLRVELENRRSLRNRCGIIRAQMARVE